MYKIKVKVCPGEKSVPHFLPGGFFLSRTRIKRRKRCFSGIETFDSHFIALNRRLMRTSRSSLLLATFFLNKSGSTFALKPHLSAREKKLAAHFFHLKNRHFLIYRKIYVCFEKWHTLQRKPLNTYEIVKRVSQIYSDWLFLRTFGLSFHSSCYALLSPIVYTVDTG